MASDDAGAVRTLSGGFGAQTLSGTDGDDLIHGDHPADATVSRFALRGRAPGDDAALAGPAGAAGLLSGGTARFYAAGAKTGAGGAAGWSVGPEGGLSAVWSQTASEYGAERVLAGAPALAAAAWDGADYLFTAGHGISLSRLDAGGVPEVLDSAPWAWDSGLLYPGALAAWTAPDALRVLVAGGWEGGLSVLRWTLDGLTPEARVADAPGLPLDGAADIALTRAGGADYAVIAAAGDGALSVWALSPGAAPALRDSRAAGDRETRFDLVETAAVETAEIDGETWVYAAAPAGRLITYALSSDGTLRRAAARDGVADLAHLRVAGRPYLFAVDGEAAVEVFAIAEGGRLDALDRIALAPGPGGARALAGVAEGGRGLLLVTRADGAHELIAFEPEGDDVLDGGDGDDRLLGGAGDDRLSGGGGKDRLEGEAGDDTLSGDGGADRLLGGDGDDLLLGRRGRDVLLGGEGADTLFGHRGKDKLKGQAGDDTLHGHKGRDKLKGQAGDDTLYGGKGHDKLKGQAGDDTLHGGKGRDNLKGQAGDDTLRGGGGKDKLKGQAGDDDLAGQRGKDKLVGGRGRDILDGGGGKDKLKGGGGADELHGGGGRDKLIGGRGPDTLHGGAGRDKLKGQAGDDTLHGGKGRDKLKGGGGDDVFVFGPGDGRDRIKDFSDGDRLAFEGASGFADLVLRDRGDDLLVRHGGGRALIDGLDPDDLGPGDLLFL